MPAMKQHAGGKRKRNQPDKIAVPLLPPELDEDELYISDEDIEFVQQNKGFAKLLAGMDTKGINKHVLGLKPDWKGDNLEKFYEKKAAAKPPEKNVVTVDPANVLPVKNLDGKLEYKGAEKQVRIEHEADEPPPIPKEQKKGKKDKNAKKQKKLKDAKSQNDEDIPEESEAVTAMDTNDLEDLQTFVSTEERRSFMRTQIAEYATKLLSSSDDSLAPLKELLNTCSDEDEIVSQLAMLSLVAVFKDLIPGYRIRPPTEKELEMQVSKDVKKVRDYESTLLRNYQVYVQKLANTTKSPSLQRVALKCICGLLEAVPHFNYRESLLATIIPFTNSTDEQSRNMVSSALSSIFKQEGKHGGDATIEIMQLVADFVKENHCNLHPDVLRAFLTLSFDEDLFKAQERKRNEKKAAPQKFKSKREEKKAKRSAAAASIQKEVEEDFREASTAPDFEEKKKLQTLTLSALFETYFRVLKTALSTSRDEKAQTSHPLLLISLEGLLKYSHLISIEFMGDLLSVLRKLAECKSKGDTEEPFTVEERLQCCTTAFKIMKINMDALTVDLRDFYVQFYNILLEICPDKDSECEIGFANALQVILCDSRQHDMQRMAAFVKRLAAVALHQGTGSAVAALSTIRHLLSRYKQCRNLLENDEGGGGPGGVTAFHPDGSDPDLSGALSSVLWELTLLERHYNPEVAKLAKQVAGMLSNEGLVHCSLTPIQAISAFSSHSGGFRPPVKLPPNTVARKQHYKGQCHVENHQDQEDIPADFRSYFKLLRDIRENETLRKELARSETMLSAYRRHTATSRKTKRRKKH